VSFELLLLLLLYNIAEGEIEVRVAHAIEYLFVGEVALLQGLIVDVGEDGFPESQRQALAVGEVDHETSIALHLHLGGHFVRQKYPLVVLVEDDNSLVKSVEQIFAAAAAQIVLILRLIFYQDRLVVESALTLGPLETGQGGEEPYKINACLNSQTFELLALNDHQVDQEHGEGDRTHY